METGNYIVDVNPFKLNGPPKWWLRKLKDFDASLVVVPSRQGFFYRLAQRRPINAQTKLAHDILWKESDTRMLASYGLVPITTIISTANWDNPLMWNDLAERAPWRQGGADVMDKRVNELDAQRDFTKFQRTDQMLTDVSKDAWGMYRKKAGLRTSMYVPKTPEKREASKSPLIIIS